MAEKDSAVCRRHQPESVMQLRTIHSDAARPDVAVGVYACPACGYEVRRPLVLEPA